MITKWTDNLKTAEEKEQFKNFVMGSKPVLDRLNQLLKSMDEEQDGIERNTKMYDLPNWDYRQAHLNGFRDCLHKVLLITTLDQQENDRPIRRRDPVRK